MKKIIYCAIAVLFCLASCERLEDINIDPNRPTETHPQLQLTKVQWDAFRSFQGTGPLYAIKMLVQTDGENSNQYYQWNRGSFDPYYNMRDVTKMAEEAERINDNRYIALAKFFKAYYFYNLTLTFGDIPYSDALKGESEEGYVPPTYDNQKQVFMGILADLAEADELLKDQNEAIAGDIIYKGDSFKWRKLINAFRLKVLITLSHQEGDSDLNIKTAFAQIVQNGPLLGADGIDDGQLEFLDQEGNRYPEFNSSGYGSGMYIDETFINRLQERKDPRLFVFFTQTRLAQEEGKVIDDFSSYDGGDPAAPYAEVNLKAAAGRTSKVLERYHQDPTNEPFVLIGYSEQQLILAEAAVRGWISGDAKTYYDSGVQASFKFYETYAKGLAKYVTADKATEYLSHPLVDFSNAISSEEKIERIIMQKYVRSFLQGGWSAFYDHLRTSYPAFRRPAGVNVPYRWMYPQSEYNYNSDNVSEAIRNQFGEGNDNINQKTWWIK